MRVGIPQGLLYYWYYPLWKSFFEELGCEVVTSGNTNKKILDMGVKSCVDEACVPVKIYHGHVQSLIEKVDYIFVPRIMSICKNEYICPKFCGLPEMIKYSVPGIENIIDTTVNLRSSEKGGIKAAIETGLIFTGNKGKIYDAYENALNKQHIFMKRLEQGCSFEDAVKGKTRVQDIDRDYIAVLGHPYNIYDSFINMDIIKKINSEGYGVVTTDMLDEDRINKFAGTIPKRHFWTLGRKILGAGLSFIEYMDVAGVIYLSSFGCGIDSLVEDYISRYIKRDGRLPYIKLVLDEHTGEAGMVTRLEAFLDMIKWRKKDESNISAHGRHICSCERLS
ncbi:MAG: acyl-CoA dehydratase activase-related protein [Clostridiales bacterium]|nr:acyl-CoA dehydratase activase-related protein [Clostridiales bacterium]HBM80782.1 hypothetical protein [Clostridiaceae bacterium]